MERANQTIIRMIGTLAKEKKANWPKYLSAITAAYNSTRSGITGFSPHYLMHGWRPRLLVDCYFPYVAHNWQQTKNLTKMVDKIRCHLKAAHVEA